jgi:hypothetical protein
LEGAPAGIVEPASETSASAPLASPHVDYVLDGVRSELSASPQFQGEVADNVMLVARAVVLFLAARLKSPQAYQREDGKGAAAVEQDLQDDLFDWLQSGALTHGMTIYEPRRIGGGRADLAVAFTNQLVVNELKREQRDSSREGMQRTYAEQAGSYDATDYPFGLVPILDVSGEPPSTPRLEACVWVHRHEDSGGTRWLVFVRVPGRMSTPSAHTQRAQRS